MVHCGFVLFDCPLKSSTCATVAQLKENDFQVKIITGDNPYTACEIARQCGIVPRDREVLVLSEDSDGCARRSGLIVACCSGRAWRSSAASSPSRTARRVCRRSPRATRSRLSVGGVCGGDPQAATSCTARPCWRMWCRTRRCSRACRRSRRGSSSERRRRRARTASCAATAPTTWRR